MTKPAKWHVRPAKTPISLGYPSSLIRVFAVRMKKALVLGYPLSAQRRLWSVWMDVHADLSSLGAHISMGKVSGFTCIIVSVLFHLTGRIHVYYSLNFILFDRADSRVL